MCFRRVFATPTGDGGIYASKSDQESGEDELG